MSSADDSNHGIDVLWNRFFILCMVNNLFLFTYYFALLTVLPIYIMKSLGGSVSEAGLALTLFLMSSIAIRPFSGLLIEKIGKKRLFRGSALFFVLIAFTYLIADQLWILLVVRFIHGVWFSILTTVTVPIVHAFIPHRRKGEGMGYFVMSTNLGVVFGPFIALTILQYFDFMTLFKVLTLMMVIGLIFCLILPVDEDRLEKNITHNKKSTLSIHDIVEFKVIPIGLVALLTAFAYSSVMSFISTYAESKHLLSAVGLFFIIFAISMLLVRPWVGKFFDRKGANFVVYPCFIFFIIGLVTVSLLSSQWTLWLAAVFIGVGYGSLFPCFQTVAIQSVSDERMGHSVATFFTLFDVGMAAGSIVMGVLIAYCGYSLTYLFCAFVMLIAMLFYTTKVAPQLASR